MTGRIFSTDTEVEAFQALVMERAQKEKQARDNMRQKRDVIMENIFKDLQKQKIVDYDDILDNQGKYDYSYKEFSLLYNDILQYALNQGKSLMPNNFLTEIFLKYKESNIVLAIMVGQGSITTMSLNQMPDKWHEDKAITFEQYKEAIQV